MFKRVLELHFIMKIQFPPPPQIMNLKFMMVQQGGFKILHRNIMENILESFPEAQGCNSLN